MIRGELSQTSYIKKAVTLLNMSQNNIYKITSMSLVPGFKRLVENPANGPTAIAGNIDPGGLRHRIQ
jgi:hypothetical protein